MPLVGFRTFLFYLKFYLARLFYFGPATALATYFFWDFSPLVGILAGIVTMMVCLFLVGFVPPSKMTDSTPPSDTKENSHA